MESGNTSAKVAEVFLTAGLAFQKLGDLTLQLNAPSESQENMRWTDQDVDQLQVALDKFANDLDSICRNVQGRAVKQIKSDLKRKAALGSFGSDETARDGSPAPKKAPPARKVVKKSYGAAATPRPVPSLTSSRLQQNVNLLSDGYGDIGPPSF